MKFFYLYLFLAISQSAMAQRELKFYEEDYTFTYCMNLYKYKSLHDSKELYFYEDFFLKSLQPLGLKTITEYEYLDHHLKTKIATESIFRYQNGYLVNKSIIDHQQKKKEETSYIYSSDKLIIKAHTIEKKEGGLSHKDALFQFDELYRMTKYSSRDSFDHKLGIGDSLTVTILYDSLGNIDSINESPIGRKIEITIIDNDNMETIFTPLFSENDSSDYLKFKTYRVTSLLNGKAVETIFLSVSETTLYWFKSEPNTRVYYAALRAGFDEKGKIKSIETINNDRGDERVLNGGHSRKYRAYKEHKIWNEAFDLLGNIYRNKFIVDNNYVESILPRKSLIMQIK